MAGMITRDDIKAMIEAELSSYRFEIGAIIDALKKSQSALQMVIAPGEIAGSTIISAFANCVEAEAAARAALNGMPHLAGETNRDGAGECMEPGLTTGQSHGDTSSPTFTAELRRIKVSLHDAYMAGGMPEEDR